MFQTELEKMHIRCDSIEPIRSKDGVHVARVRMGAQTAVLKCFEKEEYRREIANYRTLRALGVRTLEILAESEASILMEDAGTSATVRLGEERDLASPEIAAKVALWYRDLHEKGRVWVAEHGAHLYDETDLITRENLACVREKTGTSSLPIWQDIDRHLDAILRIIHALPRTLTYNDFYYTNLICARDSSFAFMYDYNLLGKGYVLADIRNVCSSLSAPAQEAFLAAYGPYDPAEEAVDAVASTLTTLVLACRRPSFPQWAQPSLQELHDGLAQKLQKLLQPLQ